MKMAMSPGHLSSSVHSVVLLSPALRKIVEENLFNPPESFGVLSGIEENPTDFYPLISDGKCPFPPVR
jgi:hypothetical protein